MEQEQRGGARICGGHRSVKNASSQLLHFENTPAAQKSKRALRYFQSDKRIGALGCVWRRDTGPKKSCIITPIFIIKQIYRYAHVQTQSTEWHRAVGEIPSESHGMYERVVLLFEDLQSSDESLQTQQVISVGRDVDFIQDHLRGSLGFLIALLAADYVLLRRLNTAHANAIINSPQFHPNHS